VGFPIGTLPPSATRQTKSDHKMTQDDEPTVVDTVLAISKLRTSMRMSTVLQPVSMRVFR